MNPKKIVLAAVCIACFIVGAKFLITALTVDSPLRPTVGAMGIVLLAISPLAWIKLAKKFEH